MLLNPFIGVNADGEGKASAEHTVTLKEVVVTPELPADAGAIQGPTEVEEDGSIELTIAEIEGADTYKWYKDGEEAQNTDSRTLTVTAVGTYKVAGVNADGEGKASADHVVTLYVAPLDPPAAAGTITGETEFIEGGEIELSIDEIERAET